MTLRQCWFALLTIGCWVANGFGASDLVADEWTSLDGSRTVDAEMIGLWDDQVLLLMSDGRRINVPMSSLIAESRIQAEKLAVALAGNRERLSNELRQVADAEAAAAPDPLPTPPPTIAAVKVRPNLSAREAMQLIQDQIMGGRFVVLYRALPPKMRSKVETCLDLWLRKSNPDENRSSAALTHRMAELIVTRQNWIASHPRIKAIGGDGVAATELFQDLVVPACQMIRDGLQPDVCDPQVIADADLQTWLNQREEIMAPFLAQIIDRYADPEPSRWEVDNGTDDTATLRLMPPEQFDGGRRAPPPRPVTLTKVVGYWIPERVAEEFVPNLDKLIDQLRTFDDGGMTSADQTQLLSAGGGGVAPSGFGAVNPQFMMTAFDNFLAPLEAAQDAASFHQAADQVITSLQGLAAMMGPRGR